MMSKMLRSLLSYLLLVIGERVAIAGDSWVNPITLHGLVTQEYWKAIEHSRSTLPNFVASFHNRSKAQSRFLVSGLVEIGDHFVPVGVLVDRVDKGKLFGTRLENDSKAIQGEQRAEIDSEYVVDWSYVDLWELQGGELWRKVYNRLGEGQRIGAMQYIYGICQLESPPGQTAIQRSLLRSIVESDYELFEKLFREAGSPDSIPMTKYDGERHWTTHGLGYPSELVLQFSSIGFIEQSFRTIFHKSEDHMFTASCIKRPEVFEFVCKLGVSAESKTSTQVTPLHIAAQSGDEYAVARLLEMQVDVNAQDNGGRTALHKATNAKVFSMLLEAGGDPSIKTNSRVEPQNAMEKQIAEGRVDILEECERRGLVDPAILAEFRKEPSVQEKGSNAIQEYEESIGSDTYAVSSWFRAGPVLPFDHLDAKSGRIGFNR